MDKKKSLLALSFLPSTAVLEMTYKCNYSCLYCSCPWEARDNNFAKHNELTTGQWKECISQLIKMGVTNIAFSGGEPLLRKDLIELIEFTSLQDAMHIETKNDFLESEKRSPNLYLLTNSLLMTDGILNLCKKYSIHLSMSLPGIKTYVRHTGYGDPFKVLEWFKKAESLNIATTVNITVTKINLFELYETISLALINGADSLLMNRFLPGGRGIKNIKKLFLNKNKINKMLSTAEKVLKLSKRYGNVGTELPKCIIKDQNKFEHLEVGTTCSAAKDFFVIGPSGHCRVCNHSPIELFHYTEIEKLKTDDYWNKFVWKNYIPDHCKTCSLSTECDGGCREAASIVSCDLCAMDPVFVLK